MGGFEAATLSLLTMYPSLSQKTKEAPVFSTLFLLGLLTGSLLFNPAIRFLKFLIVLNTHSVYTVLQILNFDPSPVSDKGNDCVQTSINLCVYDK